MVFERPIARQDSNLGPLDLDNPSRRDIPQYIDGGWYGWHSFRRGLGSRLHELDVDPNVIQIILWHADMLKTSMASGYNRNTGG
jgi:hypothetical protein